MFLLALRLGHSNLFLEFSQRCSNLFSDGVKCSSLFLDLVRGVLTCF